MRTRLSIRLWLCAGLLALVSSPAARAQATRLCFPTVPAITNCIEGRFLEYWQQNGGLPVFGYPITPAADTRTAEGTFLVQYFERNSFELHPDKARPYDVLLGRLGATLLERQGINWQSLPKASPNAAHYFATTGHAVTHEPFWQYWSTHGLQDPSLSAEQRSLALFGMPLTEAATATNPNGDTVLMQWFERARFEWHPNNAPEFQVLLGLLGNEALSSPSTATCAGIPISQIRLDTQGLPYSWQPVCVAATPYDDSQPPVPTGLPTHVEILFGVTDPAMRQPGSPIIYIIPIEEYEQLWDDAGNPSIWMAMDEILRYSVALPSPPPTSGVAGLPFEEIGARNDLAVQVGRAAANDQSATRQGYRFVGRWVQDANPVTDQGLKYVYQGPTTDGKYLVAFFYPVRTDSLPDMAAEVPPDEIAWLQADSQAYLASKAAMLNALAPADWEPNLATLDALVGSLQLP